MKKTNKKSILNGEKLLFPYELVILTILIVMIVGQLPLAIMSAIFPSVNNFVPGFDLETVGIILFLMVLPAVVAGIITVKAYNHFEQKEVVEVKPVEPKIKEAVVKPTVVKATKKVVKKAPVKPVVAKEEVAKPVKKVTKKKTTKKSVSKKTK